MIRIIWGTPWAHLGFATNDVAVNRLVDLGHLGAEVTTYIAENVVCN